MSHPSGSNRQTCLRAQLRALFNGLIGPYRYREAKFLPLVGAKWDLLKQIVQGADIVAAPSYIEIHPAEPCQLNCQFCRGELRDVPKRQAMMAREHLLQLIDSLYALNPQAFLRFSGVIGEPLLHPHVVEVFERVNSYRSLAWGLTTNGLLLDKPGVISALWSAKFAHISIDAGSDATYQRLKKGRPGDFEQVMANLETLAHGRAAASSRVEVVASLLLQSDNFREIPALSQRLKHVGVDTLEIKMQHFDARRGMRHAEVEEAYRLIDAVRQADEGPGYRIVKVQDIQEALAKVAPDARPIDFPVCYANRLGLNATVDPTGGLQTCCQYYQATLGCQGQIHDGFVAIWGSEQRRRTLLKDPRRHCVNCSPSDEFVNRFVACLQRAYEYDPTILTWVEATLLVEADLAQRGPARTRVTGPSGAGDEAVLTEAGQAASRERPRREHNIEPTALATQEDTMAEHVTAIILCLGQAVRMRPLSLGVPKSGLKFCLRPLLEYTLEQLVRHRILNIVLVTGLGDIESERFRTWGREHGLTLQIARRGLDFGSAGVVRSVVHELQADDHTPQAAFCVIYGDSLLQLDFTGMLAAHRVYKHAGGLVTVAYHQPEDVIVAGQPGTNYGILSLNAERRIERFREKPPVREIASPYASAGVFLLDPRALALFPSRSPADLSMDVLGPAATGQSSPLFGFDIAPGYRYDIGTLHAYMERQFDVLKGRLRLDNVALPFTPKRAPPFRHCALRGAALIGSGCAIADGVVLSGTNVIGDGVAIGRGSQIENSIILDNAWIGAEVRMSRTIVGPSARVGDGAVLADGSVLGGWSIVHSRSTASGDSDSLAPHRLPHEGG